MSWCQMDGSVFEWKFSAKDVKESNEWVEGLVYMYYIDMLYFPSLTLPKGVFHSKAVKAEVC